MTSWIKYIKLIATRPIFFYLFCVVAVLPFLNYPLFKKNSMDQTMNRFDPPINYIKDFTGPHEHFDEFKLHQCVDYHKKVVEYYNFEKPAAYAMLGFCSALLGQTQRALKAYEASIEINPQDFWPYYNLGVINYKKNDYQKAVQYLQEALVKNPQVNLYVLYRSKVYSDIRLSNSQGDKYNFFEGLRQGRETVYIFLMDSLCQLKDYSTLFAVASTGLKEDVGSQDIFYYYAGRSAFHQKFYEKAVELLEIAIQKNPQNADAILYLGMCLHIAGKEEAAKHLLDTSKKILQEQGSVVNKHLSVGVRFF